MKKILLTMLISVIFLNSCSSDTDITLNIILPEIENVRNLQTNHYKLWLEEKTGYNIVFTEISSVYEQEYISQTISNEDNKTDIVLFGGLGDENVLLSTDEVLEMTEYFYPIDEYIVEGTNLHNIFMVHSEDGWREFLSHSDGKLYFIPTANPSRSAKNGQSIWINTAWLADLGISIPTTTQEFEHVLSAFKTQDANNNGIADEIPLAGSMENYDTMSYLALINAFVYYDPKNYGFYVEENKLYFSPTTLEFREALIYLNSLYEDGLLHSLQFELDARGLTALATDPENILGAFSASHLSDVFTEYDSNRFSHFTQLAPLEGLVQVSVPNLAVPQPTAAISIESEHPNEAFELLDLMCSEEAFLISQYGEENVDWEYAESINVDIFGGVARINTINHLSGVMQNKNLDSIASFYHYPEYVDSVRYTDFDIAYFNARALLANEPYFVESDIGLSILELIQRDDEMEISFSELNYYTHKNIKDFITGVNDINSDDKWDEYINGFEEFNEIFIEVGNGVLS